MTATEALDTILKSYHAYYDVTRFEADAPFAAEAVFHSHDEQYFLVKSARISEAESNELVFFSVTGTLDQDGLAALDDRAWNTGLGRVTPHKDHRNTDITLVVLADRITAEGKAAVKKMRHHKSFSFGFQGWSSYRLVALECSSGQLLYNRMGSSLKKLYCNILHHSKVGELS